MNETIQSIKSRFSCRHFSSQPVPDELLQQIVDAAKYAPSGKNAQGWHFTVIRTSEGRQLLRDAAGKTPPPGFPQGKKMAAPGMPDVPWPEVGPVLAAENLMIAASSLGLATLWSTVFTRDLFRDEESLALKARLIPEGYELKATIFVGYPKKEPQSRPPRRGDVERWL